MLETLGEGASAEVMLGRHKTTGQLYALKCFRDSKKHSVSNLDGMFNNEIAMHKNLDNQHIVKLLSHKKQAVYRDELGQSEQVSLIVSEYAKNGRLYEYLSETGGFGESLARHYGR